VPYQEPDFLPWDGRRVPLTLIGGYLGAGKTTLINELLARTTRPIAVLVNDVGAVNVDAALIRRRSADTIEFTDGCVCCSLSDGVGAAFDQLRARPTPPEHVVLELSGVAEPVRVAPWGRSAGFRLDGTVVVVDAEQLAHQLADDLVATAVTTQITSADLVMVSKADLVSASRLETVRSVIDGLAPGTPIVTADSGFVYAGLLDLGGGRVADDIPPPTLFDVHTVSTVPFPPQPDEPSLHRLLDGLDAAVVRAKGVAEAGDGTLYLVQVVGRRRCIEALPPAERTLPTDLVVISLDRSDRNSVTG
jgi:G3E family GTPase